MQILKDQDMIKKRKLGAIVLAGGKGKRMNSNHSNKVTLPLGKKPMIVHGINLLKKLKIKKIVVVVGFKKESVIKILNKDVIYAIQRKRLGTAHAASCGFKKIPKDIDDVLIINGDDSAFYTVSLIKKLINKHYKSDAQFTFLTIKKDDPTGLGRVVRDDNKKLIAIVEEKDAVPSQKLIKEVNPSCYIFKTSFLRKYLKKVEKSKFTGEYYLTRLIRLGIKNNVKIETMPVGNIPWRGVNTKDELLEAERLFKTKRN